MRQPVVRTTFPHQYQQHLFRGGKLRMKPARHEQHANATCVLRVRHAKGDTQLSTLSSTARLVFRMGVAVEVKGRGG